MTNNEVIEYLKTISWDIVELGPIKNLRDAERPFVYYCIVNYKLHAFRIQKIYDGTNISFELEIVYGNFNVLESMKASRVTFNKMKRDFIKILEKV